ncbi:sensor histidine kinase [Micromonospora chalcea]|uniref:sensor histidine kinase n=1 Tax=Micromonospora sp. TSRI0369 TaxID=1703936 RepID=UPI0011614BDB|nr:histidine kinase [Micromonospora sp. TSRI0369]
MTAFVETLMQFTCPQLIGDAIVLTPIEEIDSGGLIIFRDRVATVERPFIGSPPSTGRLHRLPTAEGRLVRLPMPGRVSRVDAGPALRGAAVAMLVCVMLGGSVVAAVRVIQSGDAETTFFVATALALVCSYGTAGMILIGSAANPVTGTLFFTVAMVWLARSTGPLHGETGTGVAAVAHPLIWTLLVAVLVTQPHGRTRTRADRVLLAAALGGLPLLVIDSYAAPASPIDPCLACLPEPGWAAEPYGPVAARLVVSVVAIWLAVHLIRRWQRAQRVVALPGILLCVQVSAAAMVPVLTTTPHLAWLVSNAAGVVLQILIPPSVLLANARGWRADAALWERRYEQEARNGRHRARSEIERDLHDGAQLRLVTATLLVQMARRTKRDTAEADAHLDAAVTELGMALTELRLLSRGMRPPALDRRELHEALAALTTNTPVTVRIEGRPRLVPREVAEAAYFVVAEALTNAVRHGGASTVVIRMRMEQNCLYLEVCDDGSGSTRTLDDEDCLSNLCRRAEALGGRLELESRPGVGTTLRTVIPCASSSQTTRC